MLTFIQKATAIQGSLLKAFASRPRDRVVHGYSKAGRSILHVGRHHSGRRPAWCNLDIGSARRLTIF